MDARTEATDPIERELTADGAPVRLRDKHIARSAALLSLPGMVFFLIAAVAVALGAEPAAPRVAALIPFAMFAAMAYTVLANMVVRTAVTDRDVRVRWGMRRITIPLAAVTRCEARGRTGAVGPGAGWSIFADKGAVHIAWTEEAKERAVLLPAHDPPALAAAIEAARAGATGVRVETEVAAAEELPAERGAAEGERKTRG